MVVMMRYGATPDARRSGRQAAVSKGLQAGDLVIVYPSDRIAAGVRVTAKSSP